MTELAWVYTAGPFEVFGHRFAIGTNDKVLGPYLDELWGACGSDAVAATTYGLEVVPASGSTAYRLHADDVVVRQLDNASIALRDLIRRINRDVVHAAADLVVVHAAGAVRDGVGVLFPAAAEAGKTTLVAGLVGAGWKYLSDEAVGIDAGTLELQPYLKPLSVDPGSWEVLSDLSPQLPPALASYNAEQWQLPPECIRDDALAPPSLAAWVIAPTYEPGAPTKLEPLKKSQTLMLLAENCFTLGGQPSNLATLGALARRCACYRLSVRNLDEACALLTEAVLGRPVPLN